MFSMATAHQPQQQQQQLLFPPLPSTTSRPRTSPNLDSIPPPFPTTRTEPLPRPSFSGPFPPNLRVNATSRLPYKEENKLKRTIEGVVTNVEKMARRMFVNRPVRPEASGYHRVKVGMDKMAAIEGPSSMINRTYRSKSRRKGVSCASGQNLVTHPSTASRVMFMQLDLPANSGAAARAAAAEHKKNLQSASLAARQDVELPPRPVVDIMDFEPESIVPEVSNVDQPSSDPEGRADPVKYLPTELCELIFKQLDMSSLRFAERVSKSWRKVANSNPVWRSVFLCRFLPGSNMGSSYLQMGGLGLGLTSPRAPRQSWKSMSKARSQIETNWRNAAPRSVYYSGHTDSVYCCQFDEDKIITGSRDRTVRVWDLNSYKCIRVIGGPDARPSLPASSTQLDEHSSVVRSVRSKNGTPEGNALYHIPSDYHSASILCLQFDREIMVTGSSDTTCIVWDVKSFEPITRLRHHQAGVLDICFDTRYIVSCSKDATICVWSRETYQLIKVLEGHLGPVNAVQMRGDHLVSASGDGMSKMWSMTSLKLHRNFLSRDRGLAAVEFSDDGKYVLAGGNDQVIYKYDAESCNLINVYQGHTGLVRSLFLDYNNRRVLSGSYDQGMRVYDFDSCKQIAAYNNWTTSWILAAKSDYRRIVATSQDGRVLVMDFGHGVEGVEDLKDAPLENR